MQGADTVWKSYLPTRLVKREKRSFCLKGPRGLHIKTSKVHRRSAWICGGDGLCGTVYKKFINDLRGFWERMGSGGGIKREKNAVYREADAV